MKNRIFKYGLGVLLSIAVLGGCGKKVDSQAEAAAKAAATLLVEVNQNDYRGAITRTKQIKESITQVLNERLSGNAEVMGENRSDYWNDENFMYFTTNLLEDKTRKWTTLFNETETDWDTVVSTLTANMEAAEIKKPVITRIGENEYKLEYSETATEPYVDKERIRYDRSVHCFYDANHDWAYAAMTSKPSGAGGNYKDGLYQYARRNNTFVIQTEDERLLVTYGEPKQVEQEVITKDEKGKDVVTTQIGPSNTGNLFVDREIESFYYSSLNGRVLPTYVLARESDANYVVPSSNGGVIPEYVTPDGDVSIMYNQTNNDIFTRLNDIGPEWVTEDGDAYYAQSISYVDGTLTVRNYNPLSNMIEVFVFDKDGFTSTYAEQAPDEFSPYNNIDIENLAGTVTHAKFDVETNEGDVSIKALHSGDFGIIADTVHGELVNGEKLGVDGAAWHGHVIYGVDGVTDYGTDYTASYDLYSNRLEDVTFVVTPSVKATYSNPTYTMDYETAIMSVTAKNIGAIEYSYMRALDLKGVEGEFSATIKPVSDEAKELMGAREFTITGNAQKGADIRIRMDNKKVSVISTKKTDFEVSYEGMMPAIEDYEIEKKDVEGNTVTEISQRIAYNKYENVEEYLETENFEIDFGEMFKEPELEISEEDAEVKEAESEEKKGSEDKEGGADKDAGSEKDTDTDKDTTTEKK